jgi:hypothetical protein
LRAKVRAVSKPFAVAARLPTIAIDGCQSSPASPSTCSTSGGSVAAPQHRRVFRVVALQHATRGLAPTSVRERPSRQRGAETTTAP